MLVNFISYECNCFRIVLSTISFSFPLLSLFSVDRVFGNVCSRMKSNKPYFVSSNH